MTAALRDVVTAYAFDIVTPGNLRQALTGSLGKTGGVRQLWQHWFRETHGDADLGSDLDLGGSGGSLLDGLLDDPQGDSGGNNGGMSSQDLQEMLDKLMESFGGSGGQSGDQSQPLDDLLQNT